MVSVIKVIGAFGVRGNIMCLYGRIRFQVFVDRLSLCKLLILLVDDLHIVVTDLKEEHHRWRPLSR